MYKFPFRLLYFGTTYSDAISGPVREILPHAKICTSKSTAFCTRVRRSVCGTVIEWSGGCDDSHSFIFSTTVLDGGDCCTCLTSATSFNMPRNAWCRSISSSHGYKIYNRYRMLSEDPWNAFFQKTVQPIQVETKSVRIGNSSGRFTIFSVRLTAH
jgi:hypothetical protein